MGRVVYLDGVKGLGRRGVLKAVGCSGCGSGGDWTVGIGTLYDCVSFSISVLKANIDAYWLIWSRSRFSRSRTRWMSWSGVHVL
jgi:hypothetical protein